MATRLTSTLSPRKSLSVSPLRTWLSLASSMPPSSSDATMPRFVLCTASGELAVMVLAHWSAVVRTSSAGTMELTLSNCTEGKSSTLVVILCRLTSESDPEPLELKSSCPSGGALPRAVKLFVFRHWISTTRTERRTWRPATLTSLGIPTSQIDSGASSLSNKTSRTASGDSHALRDLRKAELCSFARNHHIAVQHHLETTSDRKSVHRCDERLLRGSIGDGPDTGAAPSDHVIVVGGDAGGLIAVPLDEVHSDAEGAAGAGQNGDPRV